MYCTTCLLQICFRTPEVPHSQQFSMSTGLQSFVNVSLLVQQSAFGTSRDPGSVDYILCWGKLPHSKASAKRRFMHESADVPERNESALYCIDLLPQYIDGRLYSEHQQKAFYHMCHLASTKEDRVAAARKQKAVAIWSSA